MEKKHILALTFILLVILVFAKGVIAFSCNPICAAANNKILTQVWDSRLVGDNCDCSTNSPINQWKVELYCFDLSGKTCWNTLQSQACATGCAYLNCQPNWINRQEGACLTTNQKLISYTDTNSCNKNENLPADAGLQSCNYCISNIQGPFYTDWSACSINLTKNRVKYYTDSNYNSCCALTGLSSDCEINNSTYINFTESSVCKYSLIITSIPWLEDEGLYFNVPENESSDEQIFEYNFTNSSEIDTCLLLIDNNVIATSRDLNNINDFFNWNEDDFNYNLTEGNHTWNIYCNDTFGVYNYSENRTFYAWDYTQIAPEIYLTWPNDNQIFNWNEEVGLEIPEIYSSSEVKNCSQIVDGQIRWIWNFTDWIQVGDIYYADSGKHSWSYNCINIYGITGYSENRTFYRLNEDIIPENLFLTYSNANDDLSNILGLYIFSWVGSENRFQGISFIDNISLSKINNLSDFISISNYRIFVDSVKAPWLNKNATLIFEDITFANPRILKDGVIISIPFSYINDTLTFNVTGFSEYIIEETPIIPSSSSSSSGGGGGGGGGSSSTTSTNNDSVSTTNKTQEDNDTNNIINPLSERGASITGGAIGVLKKNGFLAIVFVIVIVGIFIISKTKRKTNKKK